MAMSGMVDSAVGATVDTGVPRDVGEAGCCMIVLDNLATQDESCGGALDASRVVDHGCHGGHGDWRRVVGDGGRVFWEPLSPL